MLLKCFYTIITISLVILGCSTPDATRMSNSSVSSANSSSNNTNESPSATESQAGTQQSVLDPNSFPLINAPDFCKGSMRSEGVDKGKFCVTCTPRKLPILRCIDAPENFSINDAEKACTLSDTSTAEPIVSCKISDTSKFDLSLTKTVFEEYYENAPSIKSNFSDILRWFVTDEKERAIFLGLIMYSMQHMDRMMLANNLSEDADNLLAIFSGPYAITGEEYTRTKEKGIAAMAKLHANLVSGKIITKEQLVSGLLDTFTASLPQDHALRIKYFPDSTDDEIKNKLIHYIVQ